MNRKKLHIGIVGTGRVARAHLEALRDSSESITLASVCDVDLEKAKDIANQYNVTKVYKDYRELAADPTIDAAIVCLPHNLHHQAVIELVKSKKHVLVEKPMALNSKEAEEMVYEADRAGVTLMVGHSRRFSRAIALVRERLPEIGTIFRINISFLVLFPSPPTSWWVDQQKAGPLVILLQGSHSIDTILWLLDKTPANVYACSKLHNPQFMTTDETDIILDFTSGEIASVQLSLNTSPYVHETLIVGDRGSLRIYEKPTEKIYGFRNRVELNERIIFDEEEIPSLYANQLSEFVAAIREEREPEASGKDVLRTMKVLDAACLSSITGKVVQV